MTWQLFKCDFYELFFFVCKMRSGLVLFIALLIVGSYAVTQEDSVYVLETSNFSEWLVEQEFALVEFYVCCILFFVE